jgi:4-hydroxy-tetrahydrodipicolinate synthase
MESPDLTTKSSAIGGVLAAALTPIVADGSPDHERYIAHCRWLLANGCDGIGVLGTTGEAPSFPVGERKALLEAVLDAGIDGSKLIVGTGAAALTDTVELTAHATAAGVAGCLVVPPFFFKDVSDEGVIAAYAEVIERVGEGALRLFLYHIPAMSGVGVWRSAIESLLSAYPDTVAGLKDSSGDVDNMTGLARDFSDLAIYSGTERYLLPILEAGGAGCITAGANVHSIDIGALYAAWQKGGANSATQDAHELVVARRALIDNVPMIAAMKLLIARHLGDDAWRRVRPPLMPLDAETEAAYLAHSDAAGLTLP